MLNGVLWRLETVQRKAPTYSDISTLMHGRFRVTE